MKTLLVLAGGLGSRFGGLKQIESFGSNGEFLIDYSVYDAIRAGFKKVVFVINEKNYEVFKNTIGSRIKGIEVEYAFQNLDTLIDNLNPERTKPWGTTHAVLCGLEKCGEDVVIISADDFYGREAFVTASKFLDNAKDNEAGIVTYKIGNTLSDIGEVKRGVCIEDENHNIKEVIESSCKKEGNKVKTRSLRTNEEVYRELDTPVSMLMIAFHKSFTPYIQKNFNEFYKENSKTLDKESLFPDVLDNAIKNNVLTIKNISTDEKWYGVTYKDDVDMVKKMLVDKTQRGEYPLNLWSVISRYYELIDIITKADYDYHTLDNPSISDQEYDKYLRELINIEKTSPDIISDNTPIKKVGSQLNTAFQKVQHKYKMLSLSNVFNDEEIEKFIEGIKKDTGDNEFVCEFKIDGLSVSLIYKNGKLLQALTRGNGEVGEDITNNVLQISNVPKTLKKKIDIEVRGEIYMDIIDFDRLNEEIEYQNSLIIENNNKIDDPNKHKKLINKFKNPRNVSSGTIRQLDPKKVKERHLKTIIYQVPNPADYGYTTHYELLQFLHELGFNVNTQYNKIVHNIKDIKKFIDNTNKIRDDLEYQIDGIVIKDNNVLSWKKLGTTYKYPRFAVAYKFPEEKVRTKLKDIIFSVSRTGKVNPIALLEPVLLGGSTVSRASLFNFDNILNKDIRIGDIVIVKKAAEIIPEVVAVDFDRRDSNSKPFKMISICPYCNSKLVKEEGFVDYYCINQKCNSVNLSKLQYFVSKECMDISYLGEKTIKQLYDLALITRFSDIYKLKYNPYDLDQLPNFKELKKNNLLNNIELSKNKSLEYLINALGIGDIGITVSKVLAKKYISLENLINASREDLMSIYGLGEVVVNNIREYFDDINNINEINELIKLGVNTKYIDNSISHKFSGINFVITGTLLKYKRKDIQEIIENNGGKCLTSISPNVNYVVAGDNSGKKYEDAKKLNITILTEEEFDNMLKTL